MNLSNAAGSSLSPSSTRHRRVPHNHPIDTNWMAIHEDSNQTARQVLQGRLSTAQSHLHKDAIRQAYLALSEHDLKTGHLSESLGSLMRAVEYCTNRSQTAQISLLILQVAFGLQQYSTVREFASKVEHTVGSSFLASTSTAAAGLPVKGAAIGSSVSSNQLEDIEIKIGIAKGIERMVHGDYKAAARILIPLVLKSSNTSSSSSSSSEGGGGNLLEWPGVTSPEDVAVYAGMMALVTQDRASILELAEHPEALELVPAMKELLLQCSRANYVQCMRAFSPSNVTTGTSNAEPQHLPFLLSPVGADVYITPSRWNSMTHKIREMCLIQYLKPYQCVKLDSMHALFYPAIATVNDLQDILVDLMSRQLLPPNFRLDMRSNVLYQTTPSAQKATKDKMQVMEECVMDDMYAMLIRLACLESDLVVQDTNVGEGRGLRTRRGGARDMAHGARMGGLFSGGGDLVDLEDDDSDTDGVLPFELAGGRPGNADVAEGDTQMMDAESMAAMNPEDMY